MPRIRNHESRLDKLEAVNKIDHRIPIYVPHKRDLPTRIDELIAAGALADEDRPRCVLWLDYRHHSKWQRDDEATRRLNAQARIDTPCATWLRERQERVAEPAPDAGEGAPRA